MTDRRAQIEALCRSYHAWIPSPSRDSTVPRLDQHTGEGGTVTGKRCPSCNGDGSKRTRGIVQRCDRCKGRGQITVDAHTGRELADTTIEQAITDELNDHYQRINRDPGERGTLRDAERRRIDAVLQQLERAGEPGEDRLLAALREKDRLFARGSYAEYETAVGLLEHAAPLAYSWHARFCWHHDSTVRINGRSHARLDELHDWLAARMPDRIRVPVEFLPVDDSERKDGLWRSKTPFGERAREERDERILYALRVQRVSAEQVAARFGLTAKRVRQIDAARPDAAVASGPAA